MAATAVVDNNAAPEAPAVTATNATPTPTPTEEENPNPDAFKHCVLPDRYKTQLCRAFEKTGTCKYVDHCAFAHGPQELRTREQNRAAGLASRPAAEVQKERKGVAKAADTPTPTPDGEDTKTPSAESRDDAMSRTPSFTSLTRGGLRSPNTDAVRTPTDGHSSGEDFPGHERALSPSDASASPKPSTTAAAARRNHRSNNKNSRSRAARLAGALHYMGAMSPGDLSSFPQHQQHQQHYYNHHHHQHHQYQPPAPFHMVAEEAYYHGYDRHASYATVPPAAVVISPTNGAASPASADPQATRFRHDPYGAPRSPPAAPVDAAHQNHHAHGTPASVSSPNGSFANACPCPDCHASALSPTWSFGGF